MKEHNIRLNGKDILFLKAVYKINILIINIIIAWEPEANLSNAVIALEKFKE